MLSNLYQASTIPVLEQVVNFSEARHNVLAGNIANISTPGYRTRDLSVDRFQNQLQAAIDARDAGQTSGAEASLASGDNPFGKLREGLEGILYHDDSNVGIEQQAAELSKNQLQHNMALAILSSQFRLLHAAIGERAA